MSDSTGAKQPPKTKEQLQAELAAARLRLSSNIESLINEVHPKSIANHAINDARDLVEAEVKNVTEKVSGVVGAARDFVTPRVDDAKTFVGERRDQASGFFKDDYGWRTDRFMVVGGLVAGLLTLAGMALAVTAGIRKALRGSNPPRKSLGKKK